MAYKHYILTRFNAGLYDESFKLKDKISPDAWMEHRLALFEKFTLSSIMNQSCQNFSWILLFDEKTPKEFIHRIEDFNYANIKIHYTDTNIYSFDISNSEIWGIETYNHNNFDIITTRIDNDDAFHFNYINAIQEKYSDLISETKPFVISFPLGYILDLKSNRIVVYKYAINNCPSLISSCSKQNFKSVFCHFHAELVTKYKTFFIRKSKPYWMVIIHSQNLSIRKLLIRFNKLIKEDMSDLIKSKFGLISKT